MRASHFFIGRSFNARAIEAYDREVETTNPAHDHSYEPTSDGVICQVCGFRVSGELAAMVKVNS